nr:odorant receptor SameORX [Schistocerca americana]
MRMEHHLHDGRGSSRTEDLGGLLGLGASALSALGIWAGPEPGTTRWVRAAPTLLVVAMFGTTAVMKLCLEQVDDLEELGERIFVCTTIVVTGVRVTAALPLAMWVLDPVLTAALTSPLGQNASAVADARKTPLSLWLPVDAQASPNYEAIYAFQAFLIVFTAQASLFLDMFFIVLIIHITAELNVLNDSVAAIHVGGASGAATKGGSSPTAESGRKRHSLTWPDTGVKLSTAYKSVGHHDTDMYCQLVEAIRHHQTVMRYVQELENVMSQPLYILLSTNMMNMCLHMFTFIMLLQKDIERSSMVKMMFTFPAYLYQTGTYCIFGQAIIDQSERLVVSASSCGWPEAVPGFRRALVVFMLQASRPLRIRVGSLVTLSRNTFLQLLKDTYTMFNMLYRLQGNK